MDRSDVDRDRAVELVEAHADGDVTLRQISELLGVSTEDAYAVVVEIYDEHDIGSHEDSSPATF